MIRLAIASVVTAFPLAAVAEGGVDPSDVRFLAIVGSFAASVAGILLGARQFVRSEIKTHEVAEEQRAEARYQSLLSEIRHLHQRLVDNGALPAPGTSSSWVLEKKR